MTKEGWRAVLIKAYSYMIEGDQGVFLDSIAQQLAEEDHAKQLLHDAGFGVTGTSLLLSVQAALQWIANHKIEQD